MTALANVNLNLKRRGDECGGILDTEHYAILELTSVVPFTSENAMDLLENIYGTENSKNDHHPHTLYQTSDRIILLFDPPQDPVQCSYVLSSITSECTLVCSEKVVGVMYAFVTPVEAYVSLCTKIYESLKRRVRNMAHAEGVEVSPNATLREVIDSISEVGVGWYEIEEEERYGLFLQISEDKEITSFCRLFTADQECNAAVLFDHSTRT